MRTVLIVMVMIAGWGAAFSQDKDAIEKRAREMVVALNTGDKEEYKKFIEANYSAELIAKKMNQKVVGPDGESTQPDPDSGLSSKVSIFERLHNDLGKGKVTSIKQNGDKLDMEVAGDSGATLTFGLTFLKESPYLINGLSVQMSMGR